ncbi:indolepyruvate oxidoreductase subunit IorA [Moorella thermoacetica]|nr:thiamine pyrophosphate-dependent enzyme [Moorella thermoacetica]AKX95129.1 2-oxoacid ferredoxin oxidoreductase [Moorella thermoacetica]AKX97754.1 2-oxoacid ferredoxin oxidoreductase [Moorella thermoacetica]OIQ10678.1 2-oxoacid ferredoxin oxidoreductase [Moorella thermoacetica]OIQ56585.1 2-oxoacid ferredoxin oxidoreductase [Moorella thermoacetica]QDA01574.1 2-oxoacid ferredoxin oxidoreductase [Moorella thermoacetica]
MKALARITAGLEYGRGEIVRELLIGNHALARGAWEAGVRVAAAYPGTPSTEIIEALARYPEVYAEWAPNEKVALEVAIGAAIGGARSLAAMKHVGVNVAADPLMTLAYTGVNAGLVLVSADDPGLFSSQNEQDNRFYARMAQIPCLEPADSQEVKDMVMQAFNLSEEFDTPVILRLTTRIAHSYSLVELGDRQEVPLKSYVKQPAKYVMLPAFGKARHVVVEERRLKLAAYAETAPFNRVEWADRRVGIITSGIAYQYVKEALPGVSVLKLGLTYPLPEKLISDFVKAVKTCYVVEELEPFLEDQIRAWGLGVVGKELVPRVDELSSAIVARTVGSQVAAVAPELVAPDLTAVALPGMRTPGGQRAGEGSVPDARETTTAAPAELPGRPPLMCPGCPHRGVFYVLKKLRLVVAGDIGCYTLGATPPLQAMDSCICMGASLGVAMGLEKARGADFARRVVGVIGDSTFLHSGMTGLLDMVYNGGTGTLIILDNSTTAMTGHQDHPGTGYTASHQPAPKVDLEQIARALGVHRVQVVDSYNLETLERAIQEETAAREPSVIIARRPCALLKKEKEAVYAVSPDNCLSCRYCLDLGCPAISFSDGHGVIDPVLCNGCGLCTQVCPGEAIRKAGEEDE